MSTVIPFNENVRLSFNFSRIFLQKNQKKVAYFQNHHNFLYIWASDLRHVPLNVLYAVSEVSNIAGCPGYLILKHSHGCHIFFMLCNLVLFCDSTLIRHYIMGITLEFFSPIAHQRVILQYNVDYSRNSNRDYRAATRGINNLGMPHRVTALT